MLSSPPRANQQNSAKFPLEKFHNETHARFIMRLVKEI